MTAGIAVGATMALAHNALAERANRWLPPQAVRAWQSAQWPPVSPMRPLTRRDRRPCEMRLYAGLTPIDVKPTTTRIGNVAIKAQHEIMCPGQIPSATGGPFSSMSPCATTS